MPQSPRNLMRREPPLDKLAELKHPNLLFDAAELEELRAKRREPAAEAVLQQIIAVCDALMDPANENHPDFKTFADPRWRQRAGLELVVRPVECCSFVYAVTGERRYGEFARDLMMAVIRAGLADAKSELRRPEFREVEPYRGWRHNATHDFGNYSATMAQFYDACYDLLSDDDRRAFVTHAEESFRLMREMAPEMGRMGLNNLGARCALGNALLALAVYEEADRALTRLALHHGLRLGHAWATFALDIDGASYEGSSYCITTSVMLTQFGKAAARRGLRDLSNHPHYRRLTDFLVYNLSPTHDSFLPMNDCFPDIVPYGALVQATVHRNPVARWLYDELRAKLHMRSYKRMAISPVDYQFHDPTVPAVHPREAGYPLAKHFRGRGVVSALSSWEPDAAQVIFLSGPPVYLGHYQDDQNSFTFCALGEKFAWDAGYDDFAGVYADRAYRKTEYHNAILIDGLDQAGHGTVHWPRGHIAAFDQREDWTRACGDASRCYGIDSVIERADRHIHLHRGVMPFLVVIDDVIVEGEDHDYTFNFVAHPRTRIESRGEGQCEVIGETASMAMTILGPGPIQWRQDMAGKMPRVQATQRAARGRFAALLLPRSPGLVSSEFAAVFTEDEVKVCVTLNGEVIELSFQRNG